MPSAFSGIQIGLSSLYAQRRGLDVTGQNIANANTEGYSRQRVDFVSDAGPLTPAIHSQWNGTGQGVRSGSVERLRDMFLETRAHQEHSTESALRRLQGTMARVELAFGEPSSTGLAAQLGDFWAGWDDVANHPEDLASRNQLLERARTLADGINQTVAALDQLRETTVEQAEVVVTQANSLADRVAELNNRIQVATNGGLSANDLMDQRDTLVMELADLVGASIRPAEGGMVDVFVGANALVRGTRQEPLELENVTDPVTFEVTTRAVWSKDGTVAAPGGELAGLLQSANTVLPGYRAELLQVADQLETDVNTVHQTGYDLDGVAGEPFFVRTGDLISVNPTIAGDPRKVAASDSFVAPVPPATTPTGDFGGEVARQLAMLLGPDQLYRDLVVGLGVDAQTVNRRVDIQSAITTQVEAARESEAGVNMDEEMVALVQYQHAYDAAARYLVVVDEMLATLVGLVGR